MVSDSKFRFNPDKHHRRSIRLRGYDYTLAGAYFITICAYERQSLFGEITAGEMALNPLGQIVRAYWEVLTQKYPSVELDEFVVMPNHFHGILVLDGRSQTHGVGEIIRGFKTFSARQINRIRQTKGIPVWQRNYYEHIIRNEAALQNIRNYIQNNPRSWLTDQLHPKINSPW